MSRSYKRVPWTGDTKGKIKKRIANHKVRNWLKKHPEEPLNGTKYKKVYESWDICDYGWVYTWKAYWSRKIQDWKKDKKEPFPNKKEEYRKWYLIYKMK